MKTTMDVPTRVVIEITGERYGAKVFAGDVLLKERSWTMVSRVEAHAEQNDDWLDDLPDFEELAEAIDDIDGFSVASELRSLKDFG